MRQLRRDMISTRNVPTECRQDGALQMTKVYLDCILSSSQIKRRPATTRPSQTAQGGWSLSTVILQLQRSQDMARRASSEDLRGSPHVLCSSRRQHRPLHKASHRHGAEQHPRRMRNGVLVMKVNHQRGCQSMWMQSGCCALDQETSIVRIE